MTQPLLPEPGSVAEVEAFRRLQAKGPELYRLLTQDPRTEQCVVIVPSLSLDARELAKVSGVWHYEERMLVNLFLLRQPRTKVVYVTSQSLDPVVVDYALSLLHGVPRSHAVSRLVLLDCHDSSPTPLTHKILARPRMLERIREEIPDRSRAHIVCFNSTAAERTLAVSLGILLHSVDPDLSDLGSKSGSREVLRASGVLVPPGFERLRDADDIASALGDLLRQHPQTRRAVVKLNEGFSGEGNAVFVYEDLEPGDSDLVKRIRDRLPTGLYYGAPGESWEGFSEKFEEMEGVVEAFVEGDDKRSPSVQCRVNALGQPQVISTHDQVLGGPTGQVFLGCTFPAIDEYRLTVQDAGKRIAGELGKRGVIGRFGIDFVSVKEPGGWRHYAIEINLRKGGTTHPYLTLKFLTSGHYEASDGHFYAQSGRPKYYFATDTMQSDRYVGLMPEDLMDIAVYNGLHFHAPSERGVVFHLIGALSQFGKLGMVAIGDHPQQARFLYRQTLAVLEKETGGRPAAAP